MKKMIHKKSILFIIVLIVLTISIIMGFNIYFYNKEPLKVLNSFSFNTNDSFDVEKMFNQKVNLNNYEIVYLKNDKLEKFNESLDAGVYEVVIKDKKKSLEYESIVTVIDNSGPEIELNENNIFNSKDYLEIATFVKNCIDNVSYECRYNVYDEEEKLVSSFSHEIGNHTYILEAYDENDNKTYKIINYIIDDSVNITTKYGVYYSNEGFSSDNPIASQALSYVGLNGYNCEAFFYMSLFNTPGIKEQIHTYSDRQKFIDENRYEVSLLEAMPGDELRFTNNGYGQPHVATYIGNGLAVHGGLDGLNVGIFDALTPIASIPRVYRYKVQ
jgi:hypothetical protein